MAWEIEFTGKARKQLRKLAQADARRIVNFLRQRLSPLSDARQLGKALQGPSSELWRYRVGKFRLVCEIQDDRLVVLVVRVGQRDKIYRKKTRAGES